MLDSYHTSQISREHITYFKAEWIQVKIATDKTKADYSSQKPLTESKPRYYPKPITLVSNVSKHDIEKIRDPESMSLRLYQKRSQTFNEQRV